MNDERITSGVAALQTDSGDVPTEGPWIVHGIAIGENDVTKGGSGKETLWPKETLEEAAEGLEGQPLATDTDHTAENPQAQTPVEAIAGEVTWSGYKPGVGVLYEAEVDDKDLAKKINNGRLEVSPLVSRELEALEDDTAEYQATKITRWRDLALVANGAAPSNEITVGSNPMKAEALHETVEALQEDIDLTPPDTAQSNAEKVLRWREEHPDEINGMTDVGWNRAEQLASGGELTPEVVKKMAQFNRHRGNSSVAEEHKGKPWKDAGRVAWLGWGGDTGVNWAIRKSDQLSNESMADASNGDSGTEIPNAEALKEVAGVTFESVGTGDLDESDIPNDDYEGHYLYPDETKSESSYPVVDGDGVLRRGNVEAAWQLGARGGVDEDEHDERLLELAQEFENPPEWATQSDDGTDESMSQSSVVADSDEETMTDELTETDTAVLEAADSVDEPVEALEEYAATEQPAIVEQDEYESLQENVSEVRDVLSEALADKTELKESTIEALGFEALCDEFRNEDGDLQVEALRQVPETGEPDESESEEGVEALGEDADVEKAEALMSDYQMMSNPPQGLEDDITEALGVSDFDEATEVLN